MDRQSNWAPVSTYALTLRPRSLFSSSLFITYIDIAGNLNLHTPLSVPNSLSQPVLERLRLLRLHHARSYTSDVRCPR